MSNSITESLPVELSDWLQRCVLGVPGNAVTWAYPVMRTISSRMARLDEIGRHVARDDHTFVCTLTVGRSIDA